MALSEKEVRALYAASLNGYREDPDGLFRLWQRAGRIPKEYSSWQQLEEVSRDYIERYKLTFGKNPRSLTLMSDLGINFEPTVENKSIFDRKGNISVRALDDAIHPAVQIWMEEQHPGKYQEYENAVKADWKLRGKQGTNELRGVSGQRADRGHVTPGSAPASTFNNQLPQHGVENSVLRDSHRIPAEPGVVEDWGYSRNQFESATEWLINPTGDPNLHRSLLSDPYGPDVLIEVDRLRQPNPRASPSNQLASDLASPKDYRGTLARAQRIDELRRQGADLPIDYRGSLNEPNYEIIKANWRHSAIGEAASDLPQMRAPRSIIPRGSRGALAALPFVPVVLGGIQAAEAAIRGDNNEAGGVLLETGVGEVPIVGDILQPSPVAGASTHRVVINGRSYFVDFDTNSVLDKPGYGVQQRNGKWEFVKRGEGAADRRAQRFREEAIRQYKAYHPGFIAANVLSNVWRSVTGLGKADQPYLPKQSDLTPEQWSAYKAGGGQASVKQGKTLQDIITQGRQNRVKVN